MESNGTTAVRPLGKQDAAETMDVRAFAGVWRSDASSFTIVAVEGGAELLFRERVGRVFRGSELALDPDLGFWTGDVFLTRGLPESDAEEDDEHDEVEVERGPGRQVGRFRVRFEQEAGELVALSQACAPEDLAAGWVGPISRSRRAASARLQAPQREAVAAEAPSLQASAEPVGSAGTKLVGGWRSGRGPFTVAAVGDSELLYREKIAGDFLGGSLSLGDDGWFSADLYRTQYEDSQSGDGMGGSDGDEAPAERAPRRLGRIRVRVDDASGEELALSQLVLSAEASSDWDGIEVMRASRIPVGSGP